jgi:PAS domain S-box-containing protein
MSSEMPSADLLLTDPLGEDYRTQTEQFFRFTQWFRGSALAFGIAAMVAALYWRDFGMGITAAAVLDFALFVSVARYWLNRGRRHPAVMAVCMGLAFNALLILYAQPMLSSTLLVSSIVPVTLSLQYARPGARRLCLVGAPTLLLIIALGGKFHTMPTNIPGWFLDVYEISSVIVVGAMFLLLITQGSTRLFNRLDEVQRAWRETESTKQDLEVEHGRLCALVDSQQDCVVAADRLGRISLMNPAAEALTGWAFADARARHVADVVMLETEKETTEEVLQRVLSDGKPFVQTEGVALISRDGQRRPVSATAAPIHGRSGELHGGIFTFRDMTQYFELLARVRQTERFEVIQGMAGIVGRDLRAQNKSLRGGSSQDPYGRKPYQERHGRSIATLAATHPSEVPEDQPYSVSDSFLALGRQARVSPQAFNPTRLLYEVGQSLPRMLGKHVVVFARPGQEVGQAYADYDRIRDVLLQLALAARRTMATGGSLALSTERTEIGDVVEGFILGRIEKGTYIRVDVTDSGCGYSRDELLRLFEPFQFTTHKDVDQSLRLAATYGTIRQNAGALLVESRPQVGSTFSVFLPAYDPSATPRSDIIVGRI